MSEVLDLGATRSAQGFFLKRDHDDAPFDLAGSEAATWSFCATFRNSPQSLKASIIDLIRRARKKVFVCSFYVGDDTLIDELAMAAKRLEGAVYVISALDEDFLRQGLAKLAGREGAVRRGVEAEQKRFLALTRQGVAVRGHDNFHAKFVVVDDEIAWVGSANLETKAFERNGEIGVLVNDPLAVATLARLFARMWISECSYELPADTDVYRAVKRTPTPVRFTVPDPAPRPSAGIVWTDHAAPGGASPVAPWRNDSLRMTIQDTIDLASKRLRIASMNLTKVDDKPDLILAPVARAVARGVRVELLVRTNHNSEFQRQQARLFHDLGVRVVADTLNHAKAVVADERHGVLFSANLDVDHGLIPGLGIEVGARLDGQPALAALVAYLDHAMRCADHEFVAAPTTRQLHDGLAAGLRPWPDGDETEVRGDEELWHRLTKSVDGGPALWIVEGDRLQLHVGCTRARLRRVDGLVYLEEVQSVTQSSEDQLTTWLASGARRPRGSHPAAGQPDITARGLCPARLLYAPAHPDSAMGQATLVPRARVVKARP